MRVAALLPVALALTGSAIAAAPTSHQRHGQFCISDSFYGNPVPTEDGHVLFLARPSKGKSWIASFKGPCRGMHRDSTLIIRRDGGQYCEGDKIQAFEPGDIIPSMPCIIDHFDPYTPPPPKAHQRTKPF